MKLYEVKPPRPWQHHSTLPSGHTTVSIPRGAGKGSMINRTMPRPAVKRTLADVLKEQGIPSEEEMWTVAVPNTGINSLEGGPKRVQDIFNVGYNYLQTFDGAPEQVANSVSLNGNDFTSLQGIHKHFKHIGGNLHCEDMMIRSHILGLLLIDGLQTILVNCPQSKQINERLKRVEQIMNRRLKGDRDIHACQQELIDAGFPEYARL